MSVRFPDSLRPLFGRIEAVALHLRIEKLPVDAEQARRLRPGASALGQGAPDQHLLEPGGGGGQILVRPIDGAVGFRSRLDDEVEIVGPDDIAARQRRERAPSRSSTRGRSPAMHGG